MSNILVGTVARVEHIVLQADLADQLIPQIEGVDFPSVYTTGRMISLMEQAAAQVLKGILSECEVSVGVNLNISHLAPTLVSKKVWAVATYNGMDGKMHQFTVQAFDEAGEIGNGTHQRAIVPKAKMMAIAEKRANSVL